MRTRALGLVCALLAAGTARADDTPSHPRGLKYPELEFEPPRPEDHRVVLSNGLRVYLVPDRTVPTLHVTAWIDAGEAYVPEEKRGLAKLTGELMRAGGVEGLDARALDARLDAIAAELDTEMDLESGSVTLWTLSKHAGEALDLFARVLTKPVFEEDRIRRAKEELEVEIAHRDDEPGDQLDHEVAEIVYGASHPLALRETAETAKAVTRDDIVAFHRGQVVAERTILAVAGDFERDAMVKKLESLLGGWKGRWEAIPLPAAGERVVRAGVFILDRDDLNQGFVEIAWLGIPIGHEDEVPLQIMNFVLGGGSFTSRITQRVRTDEGLAYRAGSYVRPGRIYPGLTGIYFQSKAETAAFAAKICLEEVRRIREQPVTKEELDRARNALRDRFPERFATAHAAAEALAQNELDRRPMDWLATYRARLDAVTAEDAQRVAAKHLHPTNIAVVAIGPAEVLKKKDDAHAAALADLGKIEALQAD